MKLDSVAECSYILRTSATCKWQRFILIQRHDLLHLCICNCSFETDLSRQLVVSLYIVVFTIPQCMQCTLTVSTVCANAK